MTVMNTRNNKSHQVLIRNHATALLWFLIIGVGFAWQDCSDESAHGFCPSGGTCCRIRNDEGHSDDGPKFGCIPSDMGKFNGTCCDDGRGGCPVGYECSIVQERFGTELSRRLCRATPSAPKADYITQRLPRYRLCSIDDESLTLLYGLDVSQSDADGKLAYFSSHGPIDGIPSGDVGAIQMAWIFIHGSGLNADDYFCSALAARKAQSIYDEGSVLVIAPWFAEDFDSYNSTDQQFLVWSPRDALHPWRYGADSINHNISSFTSLDVMVETLQNKLGPGVKIVVSGHSSGGQMVHRWVFLTRSWRRNNMKAVVANPSSYLYLAPRRKIDGSWKRPPIQECPQYDCWKWGLADGGSETVPYRDRALPNATVANKLIDEFRYRELTYLAGSLDLCNETEPDLLDADSYRHCHSHGLEKTCMDELQGHTRMERSNLFMESLQHVWSKNHCHRRAVVPGVGHDHSLMFNSVVGMEAIFGTQMEHCAGAESLAN